MKKINGKNGFTNSFGVSILKKLLMKKSLNNGLGDKNTGIPNILKFLENFKKTGFYPDMKEINSAGSEPEVIINGRKYLMFVSNNYLSLSTHPDVIKACKEALEIHGMGPGGSRFLCGNIDILPMLDKKLGELVGCEDSITFPTGYMANTAIFRAVMDPFIGSLPHKKGDGVIFSDEYNHATIAEGCRISYSEKVTYKHIDLKDLESKLDKYKNKNPKFIVTEGVYSMDGNIAPVKEILELAKAYNTILMIDDAHGIGILGENGGGVMELYNLQGQVDIVMGSLDKALGGLGGFLAGDKKLIEYLRIASRPYIFSSAEPACMAAGALKAIDLCKNNKAIRKKMWDNASYLRKLLLEAGFKILGNAELPVLPVFVGDENKAMKFSEYAFENGFFTPCVRWPAVPRGQSRVRLVVMSNHSYDHIEKLVESYKKIGKKLNII